ncbi:MAG: hypothetical protein HQ475_05640 [SAR202 cluster bacterium]|nr:hypothetical protein [SAR202 cluster bacterium]
MERVRIELLYARLSFSTWLDLWPESEDIVTMLNAYKGFFAISRAALIDHCFIKIGNVTDSKHKKAPSFYNLFQMLENPNPNADGFDIEGCRQKLKAQREVERKVRRYRDKKAAHSEINATPEPVHIEEMRTLLDNLEMVFHDIYSFANPGERFSFKILENADTSHLMKALRTHWDVVPKAEVVAWVALKNGSDPDTYLIPSKEIEQLMDVVGRPH